MVNLTFSHIFMAILSLSQLKGSLALPQCASGGVQETNSTTTDNKPASGTPRFVVYSDKFLSGQMPPPPDQIKGFNVFILSFLLTTGPADQAQAWSTLDASSRSKIKEQYAAAGIKLMVSAFGGTDTPTTAGADPVKTANDMGQWVLDNGLDGIDVDYEDLAAAQNGAPDWIIKFHKQLRTKLPQNKFIITHAPLAPWFSPVDDVYMKVHKAVGEQIDWYNIQFYNQGTSEYTNCDGLLKRSSSTWPKSSVFEIAASVPKEKLVIGKPQTTSDASNGFMDADMLASCLSEAKGKGWNAGAMVWQYAGDTTTSWIKTVRSKAFPV